jgi:hypothetical protein
LSGGHGRQVDVSCDPYDWYYGNVITGLAPASIVFELIV